MESCLEMTEAEIEAEAEELASFEPITCPHASLRVGDVMSRSVVTVAPHHQVADVALTMADAGISCVVVMEGNRVAGILSETDFRKIVVVQGDNIYHTKVADVMSASVESVSADVSVLDASRLMQDKHIRRLPVLDGETLVGIVTQTDLTRALTSFGHWKDIQDIMSQSVTKIQTGASIVAAARLMNISKISSIVVMHGDEVAGVLTQRDILKKVIAPKRDPKDTKVEEIMSSPVFSVPLSYSVFSASRAMEEKNIRRLVVMEGDSVRGIITQTDIFKAVENKIQTDEKRFRQLQHTIRTEVRSQLVRAAGAALLGVAALAGLVSGILWWIHRTG